MTYLQEIRTSLMSQLKNIENGAADMEKVDAIVNVSNTVVGSFNTELRAKELEFRVADSNVKINLDEIDVFKEVQ